MVLHHGLAGTLDPHSVYNHAEAVAHPWSWAAIHGLFVTGAGVGSVVAWRLNEDVRAETEQAYQQARESEERFKSAFENAPIGMALASVKPGEFGRYLQVNRRDGALTGYSRGASSSTLSGPEITHPDDVAERHRGQPPAGQRRASRARRSTSATSTPTAGSSRRS